MSMLGQIKQWEFICSQQKKKKKREKSSQNNKQTHNVVGSYRKNCIHYALKTLDVEWRQICAV